MSHAFYNYLSGQLGKMLREDRIVVFYDPRVEFSPFFDELEIVGTGLGDLPRTCVADTLTHLARFEGSFFALKAAIEPVVAADKPEPLLVYIPGVERDRQGSVLMELECAGNCYEPQLRRLARNQMRKQFTDGDIDEMLASDSLTYHDVVRFLDQSGSGSGSLVKLVLGSGSSEFLLSKWLAKDEHDRELALKLAEPELFRLVNARLGFEIEEGTSLTRARHQTLRYVLVNEFRADLEGAPPDGLKLVPAPGTKEEIQRINSVATELRVKYGDAYIGLADAVEHEFALANAHIEPSTLGAIDTFRFEERHLLSYAATLIADGHHTKALSVVSGRGHSFWVDHPSFLGRLAQWEACRLMAELGRAADNVRPKLKNTHCAATKWVQAYAADGGWFRVDRAQRTLEAWLARMEDDPEEALERAIGVVRRIHEALLKDMAKGFTEALVASGWTTPDVLHQTRIFPELVEGRGARVAYFFVDAMRFEMGADLAEQLAGAEELHLQPAVAALPSLTPVGMAALLPGASSSYSVVEHKGQLASRVGDSVLPSIRERLKLLKAVRPNSAEVLLDDLLLWTSARVGKKLGKAQLVVVRSQEIDAFGESGHELAARQVMDSIIGNISRAVRKLSKLGIEQFVITSDHGHQFSVRKAEDMTMDRPGGNVVGQHRRCWVGRGGQTPTAAVRVSGAELGYQTDLDFIFPRGLAVFKAGGDLAFHHGGISLQEMVIPVITCRMSSNKSDGEMRAKIVIEGYPRVLTNRTFGFRLVHLAEIFGEAKIAARVVLVGDGQEVGRAGMAPDAEFDRSTATVQLPSGKEISIGMMLTNETSKKVRIVVQDPATDAVLAQSEEIEVGELI
jgi:hypothetical protein